MICERTVKQICKDDISLIENYEQAVNDPTQTWECHHRLELTLDGEFAHSREELKRLGMYYHRPYFELIFLTLEEHSRIHMKGDNNPNYGKTGTMKGKHLSAEHRAKISESMKGANNPNYGKPTWNKGKHLSAETRVKLSEAQKGKKKKCRPFTAEHRARIAESRRKYWAKRREQH